MKYALIAILLLTSGCASTLTEYEQGCYDGLANVNFGTKEMNSNYSYNTCVNLVLKRRERIEKPTLNRR